MTRRRWLVVTAGMGLSACGVVGLLVCGEPREVEAARPAALELPDAPVRDGAARPMWSIALFVDLEAVESRQAFSQVTLAVAAGLLVAGPAELRLLHAPAGGCPPTQRAALRCAGARAVECAESQRAGAGVVLAGEVFDLQWEPVASRSMAEVERRAASLGVDVAALRRCVADDARVEARVREHAAFAAERGLPAAPGGYVRRVDVPEQVAPFGATDTAETLASLSECLARGRCRGAG